MAYSKEQLLARLQELQIEISKYEHPVVTTVEEQEKYVGDKGGTLTKNLFLEDKEHRCYIVSALPHTKVDLKVLALRLGVGEGGLRMAPDNTLAEILQVPPGCVTPFALVNEAARHVSLLLDHGFKTQEHCFFHPLSNDMSISLNTHGLDKFLKSVEKEPTYVDLEANPPVGKDQTGDLTAFVPSTWMVLSDPQEKESFSQIAAGNQVSAVSADRKSLAVKDIDKFVDEILEKTSTLFLSEITEDSIKQHGEKLGDVLANSVRKRLTSDLKNLTTIFKNTAYTEGFYAGTHYQPKRL